MDFGDFLWSLLIFYFIFFYFMILFRVIGDLFSNKEASGLNKTLWLLFLLFLPFLALFIYQDHEGARPPHGRRHLPGGVRRAEGQGPRLTVWRLDGCR